MAKDAIELTGVIVDCYPDGFKVKCDNGHELTAYLAGKMRKHYIRVLPGDKVIVEISPYDLSKGRITKRVLDAPRRGPAEGGQGPVQ